ncbi:hypothetical protein [Meiothermus ruber]|uniref:YbjN domain-containing protein n=1 Tax=Meiothermus ruber (strain ATCC 35948 / DSM 1279 / VKM B-1258 / 21) TaxID=504728 RepID=D3PRB1_MEIRD|nr:hypothetical protein [Meiothermus ruber]ADD27994.1 hypothetical protein Mrub_1231 [Meiothermus ruber DSM 1279]AGK04464.1 hypothetical protein K649_05810 [Meiothermus ruber DSM 1279]GAO74934.1 putative uncharacterized protein [Meiothermus ruber H328]
MLRMKAIVEDLSSWIRGNDMEVLQSKVDGERDGFLAFASDDHLKFTLLLQEEDDGLFYYRLAVFFSRIGLPCTPAEALLQNITSKVKGVKAYLDEDGDMVLGTDGFTHDPHALPFVLPRLMQVLEHASKLIAMWFLMDQLLLLRR